MAWPRVCLSWQVAGTWEVQVHLLVSKDELYITQEVQESTDATPAACDAHAMGVDPAVCTEGSAISNLKRRCRS